MLVNKYIINNYVTLNISYIFLIFFVILNKIKVVFTYFIKLIKN